MSKEKLEELRKFVWLRDIPYPTVPEYREMHQKIQEILVEIDIMIAEMDE